MAMGNRYRIRSDISASDGSSGVQSNLLATIGQPPLANPFFLEDLVSPVVTCAVRRGFRGSFSNLQAISSVTDGSNNNRLHVHPYPIPSGTNRVSEWANPTAGTVYTVPAGKVLFLQTCSVGGAGVDATLRMGGAGGTILAQGMTAGVYALVPFSSPLVVPEGVTFVTAGTGAIQYSIIGWLEDA